MTLVGAFIVFAFCPLFLDSAPLSTTSSNNNISLFPKVSPRQASTFGNCVTEGCVTAAGFILQNLDQDANPCQDFYRYACGRFLDNTWIMPDDDSEDEDTEDEDELFRKRKKFDNRKSSTTKKDFSKAIVRVYDPYVQRIENIVDEVLMPSGKKNNNMRAADRKTTQFYSTCVGASDRIDQKTSCTFVRQLLADVGGFHIAAPSGAWQPRNWSIEETMVRVMPYLATLGFLGFDITRDDYNASRFSITLTPPTLSPLIALATRNAKKPKKRDSSTTESSEVRELRDAIIASLNASAPQQRPKQSSNNTSSGSSYYRSAYGRFVSQFATTLLQFDEAFGYYPLTVDDSAITSLVDFELQLANLIVQAARNASSAAAIASSLSSPTTIMHLDAEALYTLCPAMDWLRIANRLGHIYNVSVLKLKDEQRLDPTMAAFFDNLSIYSTSNRYIVGICQLLRKTMQRPDGPATIQNYLSLTALLPFLIEMDDSFRQPYVDFVQELFYARRLLSSPPSQFPSSPIKLETNKEEKKKTKATLNKLLDSTIDRETAAARCRDMAETFFGMVISRRYAERYFSLQAKRQAGAMAEDVRQELINLFNGSSNSSGDAAYWMEAKTRRNAINKAELILLEMGYPERLMDNTWLDTLVSDLEITAKTNHLQNLVALSRYALRHQLSRLDQIPDRKEWGMQAYENNAEYDFNENAIHVTAAAAGEPFFRPDFPLAWNYGAMGYTIGHELTHSIDSSGAMYDANGQIVGDWWSNGTKTEFGRRSECLVDQITTLNIQLMGAAISPMNIDRYRRNAKRTLDENIADGGGVKLAYNAFRKRIGDDLKKVSLPGVTLTNEQVFFVSVAQSYCMAITDSAVRMQLAVDEHSPNSVRVRAMMMNSQPWSTAFKCANRTSMNPVVKCHVW